MTVEGRVEVILSSRGLRVSESYFSTLKSSALPSIWEESSKRLVVWRAMRRGRRREELGSEA